MAKRTQALIPRSLRGYRLAWFGPDVLAGLTLAAVAIPEVMGYTSITQTPIVTGLYTLLLPLAAFALLGSSRLLVVGGDSATAAILAAGITAAAIPGVDPGSPRWAALCALVALVTGVLLVLARLFRLGFLGDFLSASVLIGFLSGIGISVATNQIPDLIGVEKGSGNWFEKQWAWISHLGDTSLPTLAYGLGTVAILLVFKFFVPKIPGAIVAVVGLLVVATVTDAAGAGVAVVGQVEGGLPQFGLPGGVTVREVFAIGSTALACFFIVIAQSAATSRSFAMKHGDRSDVNRDILGLAAANLAAGLSGTFVVNGSPTKTQILDSAKGRSQVANLVVVAVTLVVVLFLTDLLAELPIAVLAGVVMVVGAGLIDTRGLRRIASRHRGEYIVAVITMLAVVVVGVTAGIMVAIALSLLNVIARQYRAPAYVLDVRPDGYGYLPAEPGVQTRPGLLVYRFNSELFFANAAGFTDRLERTVDGAPDPVRWVILDCAGIPDVDYSAGEDLAGLMTSLHARSIRMALARPEPALLSALHRYELMDRIDPEHVYSDLDVAIAAFDVAARSEESAAVSAGASGSVTASDAASIPASVTASIATSDPAQTPTSASTSKESS
ncbi:SulP family inorganic anion transporter [Plantibacter sp. Mn2098]|uniref:SulP family inorganic anion transporter n=1 Tax=Plantibacter sp. Mn2098 TaxID=3395266 RepID=UPI003BEAE4CD